MAAHPCTLRRLAALLLTSCAAPALAQTQLNEVLVSAKRDDAPARTVTTITAAEIERHGATDMGGIARYAPLISVPVAASGSGNIWDGAGNTGFNIRGIEGNRVSLDVDGIALPDAAPKPDATSLNAFGIGRDYVDPETLREVRITAGTSPAGAGTPGLGGSVALGTKSPDDYVGKNKSVYAEYKAGYQSVTGSRMQALTGAAANGNVKALAVLVHRDGRQADSAGSAAANPDDWSSDALLGKLQWTPLAGHRLGLTLDAYRAGHDRMYANKQGASYPEGARQDSHTRRTRISADYALTAPSAWFDTFEARMYAQDAQVEDRTHASYITGGKPYLRDIDTGYYNDSRGLGFDAQKQLGQGSLLPVLLAYGASYEQQETRRPWREDRTVLPGGAHQITSKNRMADMDTDKLAAYVRGEFSLTLAGLPVLLTPGVRAEQRALSPRNLQAYLVAVPAAAKELRDERDTAVTPSLSLSVDLSPAWNAYGSYRRGARLPTAAERTGTFDSFSYTGAGNGYAVLGNGSLKKETSNAFEVGLNGALSQSVQLAASLFTTHYANLIDYVAQPADPVNYPTITFGLYRPENIGKARIWGGEASARMALDQWAQGASLALAAGMSRGTATQVKTGRSTALASVLPYKASATLAWDDPGKRGGAALTAAVLRGKQAQSDTSTPFFAIPGYAVADLTGYWNVAKYATVTAGIYNVGDRKYWDYASSRSLPAGTNAVALADIERQARPGRNYAVTFKLMY
ncbi:MAG: TonB-dependent receptor [Burkholderiaceae bacterium]|nr:TonB-dependent receptor [Burkholderiaceae bacterium]